MFSFKRKERTHKKYEHIEKGILKELETPSGKDLDPEVAGKEVARITMEAIKHILDKKERA